MPGAEDEQVCPDHQPLTGDEGPRKPEHGQVMEVELLLLKFKQSVSLASEHIVRKYRASKTLETRLKLRQLIIK